MNTNCQTITESVYMRKRSQVLSIFLKAGIDMQESEDLTQEVFLRMMGVDVLKIVQNIGKSPMRIWIFR